MTEVLPADVLAALRLAADVNPFGDTTNAQARDRARAAQRRYVYNDARIAWELERTAVGDGFALQDLAIRINTNARRPA